MTDLHWYPHSPEFWEKVCEGMSLLERGALQLVLDASWRRTPAGTIADTDAELQLLLGPGWKKLKPMIRRHFLPDPELPGRLRCEWFAAMRKGQELKYEAFAKAGRERARQKGMQQTIERNRGQTRLKFPKSSSDAGSDAAATLDENPPNPSATLGQKLDSSLKPRTGAAVAVASNAPAAPQGWTGPGFDRLRVWADSDPEIAAAVRNRVAAFEREMPFGVQMPTLVRGFEFTVLQSEFTARGSQLPEEPGA